MSTLKVNDITEATSGGSKIWPNRAWLCASVSGTPAIRGDGNFSSITDLSTGTCYGTMSNALTDANYAVSMSPSAQNGSSFQGHTHTIVHSQGGTRRDPTTTVFYWYTVDNGAAAYRDTNYVMANVTR